MTSLNQIASDLAMPGLRGVDNDPVTSAGRMGFTPGTLALRVAEFIFGITSSARRDLVSACGQSARTSRATW
jgi:hypothetical protein